MQIPVAVSDLPDSNIDDIVDIDLDVLLLKTNPLQALQSLQSKLPEVAPQLRRQQHLLCPLCCSGDAHVADAAAKLLDQLAEPETAFRGGHRCFCYRSVEVEYWELDEDPESDLLFGYGVWPVAQTLSRLLIDATFSDDLQPFHPIPSVRGKSVLELGAGVALAGLSCHACGSEVRLTDGEQRLVEALKEHHGHKEALTFEVLDWNVDEGLEQFDIIVASDVLLSCCGAPEALPAVLARRLKKPQGRALLLNALRAVRAQLITISQLQSNGLCVSAFVASELLPISPEQISKLPDSTQILLVATWTPLDALETSPA